MIPPPVFRPVPPPARHAALLACFALFLPLGLALHASGVLAGRAEPYPERFQGILASGQAYSAGDFTAALGGVPFGTRVRVTNLWTGRQVTVKINDRVPDSSTALIRLSRPAFQELSGIRSGTPEVVISILPGGPAVIAEAVPAPPVAEVEPAATAVPPVPVPPAPYVEPGAVHPGAVAVAESVAAAEPDAVAGTETAVAIPLPPDRVRLAAAAPLRFAEQAMPPGAAGQQAVAPPSEPTPTPPPAAEPQPAAPLPARSAPLIPVTGSRPPLPQPPENDPAAREPSGPSLGAWMALRMPPLKAARQHDASRPSLGTRVFSRIQAPAVADPPTAVGNAQPADLPGAAEAAVEIPPPPKRSTPDSGPAPVKSPPLQTGRFVIHFGSHFREEQAQARRDELARLGVPADVVAAEGYAGAEYRVVGGPFASETDARRCLAQVKKKSTGFRDAMVGVTAPGH